MPTKIFINQDFDHSHEKSALLRLSRMLVTKFEDEKKSYFIAANVDLPNAQADTIVITPTALILLELKECENPVYGREHGQWSIKNTLHELKGGSRENPFIQVQEIRKILMHYLFKNRRKFLSNSRQIQLENGFRQICAGLVFSPQKHPESDIIIPPKYNVWFKQLGLDNVMDYVFSSVSKLKLTYDESLALIQDVFGCRPWKEIESFLPQGKGGQIFIVENGGRSEFSVTINSDINIGRSSDNLLVIPNHYKRVSRWHAHIELRGKQPYLFDGVPGKGSGRSSYGTFINGKRVESIHGVQLREGDEIVLGSVEKFCVLTYERLPEDETPVTEIEINQ